MCTAPQAIPLIKRRAENGPHRQQVRSVTIVDLTTYYMHLNGSTYHHLETIFLFFTQSYYNCPLYVFD